MLLICSGGCSVMHSAQASAAAALCCVCLLFLRSLSDQRTNSRNTLTDTVSQYCHSGDESAVLNRIAFPPTLRHHHLSPPAPLSLAQSVVIPRGCESSLCTRLLHSSWLFPEWNCTHNYIWTVSTVPPTSHTMHQTHSSSFPRNQGVFWTPLWLVFYWLFSEEQDLSQFECTFLLTELEPLLCWNPSAEKSPKFACGAS